MGVTLNQIAGNVAQVKINVGDDTCTINYYPGKITEKLLAQMDTFDHLDDLKSVVAGFGTLNEILVSLIKDWDLYEDDKCTKLFPLDVKRLAEIPYDFRLGVFKAIMGSMRPEA